MAIPTDGNSYRWKSPQVEMEKSKSRRHRTGKRMEKRRRKAGKDMKKKGSGMGGFFQTRILTGVVGILLFLYMLMVLTVGTDLKQMRIMYWDLTGFLLILFMVALLLYLGRMEKDFFRAWRLAFSRKQGVSRMELQSAANAVGYAEKAVLLSEIAISLFGLIDCLYHMDNVITFGPAVAVTCTGVFYMVLFLLILLPVKVRLERKLVTYMEEPEDGEKEREEAQGQRLYFSLRALGLTDRETEVARLAATGMHNEEIGRELYISTATVKKHMTHILEKTQCRDREALTERIKGL